MKGRCRTFHCFDHVTQHIILLEHSFQLFYPHLNSVCFGQVKVDQLEDDADEEHLKAKVQQYYQDDEEEEEEEKEMMDADSNHVS